MVDEQEVGGGVRVRGRSGKVIYVWWVVGDGCEVGGGLWVMGRRWEMDYG